MHVQQTLDYTMFKFIDLNREIDPKHVAAIKKVTSVKDLGIDNPIMIDKDGNVLDGQHTLTARKELGLPIYYFVAQKTTIEDIAMLNTFRKKWKATDHLHKNVMAHHDQYKRFQEFFVEHQFKTLTAAQSILTRGGATCHNKDFSAGTLTVPEDMTQVNEFIAKLKAVAPYVAVDSWHDRKLVRALVYLDTKMKKEKKTKGQMNKIDFDHLITRLAARPAKIEPQSPSEILRAFELAYNFHLGDARKIDLRTNKSIY
jgi:hypothetical protein